AIRPIDRQAVMSERVLAARSTIEPRPAPARRHPFDFPVPDLRESYDDALGRFEHELHGFEAEFRSWLISWEAARWPTAAYLVAYVRLENTGDAAAADLRLRVTVPEGLLRAV